MTSVVMLGSAILGEWRSGLHGRAAMPANERKTRQRRNSLSRLAHLRLAQGLALGEAAAWALAIANTIGGLGREVTGQAIAEMARSFGLPDLEPGVAEAIAQDAETARRLWGAGRHQLLTAQMVGSLLAVTAAEREEAGLRDIGAVDETSAERRRRLDRERKKAARAARAAQAGPRLTQAQMAAAEGVSLATWKRHRVILSGSEPKSVRLSSLSLREDARACVKKRTRNGSCEKADGVPGAPITRSTMPAVAPSHPPAGQLIDPRGAIGSSHRGALPRGECSA